MTSAALDSMFTPNQETLDIGERCQRGGGKEQILIDKLCGRHTAVLGTSGSGKSLTVSSVLQAAMGRLPHTRIVFLDLHDEYRSAFPEDFKRLGRKVRHISSSALRIPHWCLNAEELEALFVPRESTAANQSALFKSEIKSLRGIWRESGRSLRRILSASTHPCSFRSKSFLKRVKELDEEMVQGQRGERSRVRGLANFQTWSCGWNLALRIRGTNFSLAIRPAQAHHSKTSYQTLLGADGAAQMIVIDLSGLPSEILSVIVGVLGRLAFEYKYWDTDPNTLPLTLILEEAHNYLPRGGDAFKIASASIALRGSIAKEGA